MIKKGNSIKTHFCDLFFVFLYMRKQLPGKKKFKHLFFWFLAGMRKWMSRQAHNLKYVGSNPTPAQKIFYL